MAQNKEKNTDAPTEKSEVAKREEAILAFWRENDIFKKSLEKESPKGDFVFYDGPPFATGEPHYGHILPGTAKDVIPRYKTMRGYRVARKWGWDCHGLPVENLIEKELGLTSKKDIEEFGIEKFNDAARASVLRYDEVWKQIVPRSGRWVDMDNAYLTMNRPYMESVWWSFKTLYDKGLVYEGFKSMHVCPRCETTLSNFEVNQNYIDITDISVYVKFKVKSQNSKLKTIFSDILTGDAYFLAWTTTPWTLPGNVALAVNSEIQYAVVKIEGEEGLYIFAKDRLGEVLKDKAFDVAGECKGEDLVGLSYEPMFDYYKGFELKDSEGGTADKEKAWKVWSAGFVTVTDGTGIVHIAPAFGEDDLRLAQEHKLPFIQHVTMSGVFKEEVVDFQGQSVKPKGDHQKADIEIIKLLAHSGVLFAKEKIIHSYPHCWRCDTPLMNYATSSWFVRITDIKSKMMGENKKVVWIPEEIGEGRFGNWLENARDWAVSRSRYWGSTLPVWKCDTCKKIEVLGSVEDLKKRTKSTTRFILMRHGEGEHNVDNILSSDVNGLHTLTEKGVEKVKETAEKIKGTHVDAIIASPLLRTKKTAEIVAQILGVKDVVLDDRLREVDFGEWNGKDVSAFHDKNYFPDMASRFDTACPGGESLNDIRKRLGECVYEIDEKYEGKTVLVVSHEYPLWLLTSSMSALSKEEAIELKEAKGDDFLAVGEFVEHTFYKLPHNRNFELDLHRPYIDEVAFSCGCGGMMNRIPDVFDTWYESGSMPYGQHHYPFNKEVFDPETGKRFPADFIAESVDQTRGWFYTLLALGTGLFGKVPYKNVVVGGIVLAEDGQKMSKRLKNYPDISYIFNTYGADSLRYYLLSSPVIKAQDLSFSEKGVDEIMKKIVLRFANVQSFLDLYGASDSEFRIQNSESQSSYILDRWIIARLNEVIRDTTAGLEGYEFDKAARPILGFVDDLSTWYLRRSRDRFKSDVTEDRNAAFSTTIYVLSTFSKVLAPFMPFVAESVYQKIQTKDSKESVHLDAWPEGGEVDEAVLRYMERVRDLVSLGLEVRAKANIKVRQPLLRATIRDAELGTEYLELIKDELNVKKVVADPGLDVEVMLDTTLTDELKEEGSVRDIIRAVQELRKNEGLTPGERVVLVVATDNVGKGLLVRNKTTIEKVAGLADLIFETTDGKELRVDDVSFTFSLRKA